MRSDRTPAVERRWPMKHLSPRTGMLAVLLVLLSLAPASRSVRGQEPPVDRWPSEGTSPVFAWRNALADNEITVPGRTRPRGCRMAALYGRVRYGRAGQADVVDGAFVADFGSGRRVLTQVKESGEFALEAVITPRKADGKLPEGWIMGLDAEEAPVAFALVQRGERLVLVLGQGGERDPAEVGVVNLGDVDAAAPYHVVVNVSRIRIESWIDGEPHWTVAPNALAPGEWAASTLVFGATWDLKQRWAGTLEGVAVYDRPLEAERIKQHSRLLLAGIAKRPKPAPVALKGTLKAMSEPPDARVYPRALVLYHYAVDEVTAGKLDADEVLVYHWGILGGEKQPVLERQVGESYDLTVEPYESFEAVVKEEQRSESAFVPGVPSFYDVSR